MKTEKNILAAFILNFFFSIFEFLGGIFTGSAAIVSDAVHDIGDAASIGISCFLERKSKKQPDDNYTYGYTRFSVIGSVISTLILLLGSVFVVYNATIKIITPTHINYDKMIILAVIGVLMNATAAFFTRCGESLNQKAVNLHMLEDVLGWITVLIGAIVIKFTGFVLIDPIISIGVSVFILISAINNLKKAIDIFLEKTPHNIDVQEIKKHIKNLDDVIDVHHIHIWTLDGQNNYATMHIVTNACNHEIKHKIREILHEYGVHHITLELEKEGESCHEKLCRIEFKHNVCQHHHHSSFL